MNPWSIVTYMLDCDIARHACMAPCFHWATCRYLLTCTCIGVHLGRVEPASSRANAHWRRYFGIWLREGSQALPGKTPSLPQIFHRRINRATQGRQLPERHLMDFPQSLFSRVVALIPLDARPIRLGWSYQEPKFPTA